MEGPFVDKCYAHMEKQLIGKLEGKYQEEGVKWMFAREHSCHDVRGGLLCDRVGLGKTNQMVAVIAGHTLTKPTLIIVPVTLVSQWKDTLRNFANLNAVVLKANFKGNLPKDTKVVIAPSSMLTNCSGSGLPTVLNRAWGRVCIDEGHICRNIGNKTSTLIMELKRDIMWILTATPIQNSEKDIINLGALIGVEEGNVKEILSTYCLRRTAELKLPPMNATVIRIPFGDPAERALYDAVSDIFMERLTTTDNKKFRNTAIEGLMRLRQICTHPIVLFSAIKAKNKNKALQRLLKSGVKRKFVDVEDEENEENISESPSSSQSSLASSSGLKRPSAYYKHIKALADTENDEYVVSTEELVTELVKRGVDIMDHTAIFGSKINYVVGDLLKDRTKKSLIFCSFIEEMNLIAKHLDDHDISYVQFDGSMDRNNKDSAIENFQTTSIEVMILQIKCGSTGLNLQAASRVYIMTPNYNPTVDIQAVGRCHRKGQTEPVEVKRLVIENTVDDKCLSISNGKMDIISNALGEDDYLAEMGKVAKIVGDLTNEDLKALFLN